MIHSFDDSGGGPPLVFLHGTMMDATMFGPQYEVLADRFRLIKVNSRARGNAQDGPYTLADVVGDVRQLVDGLGIERFSIVGMSMGGFTAIEYALAFPDQLQSLILIDTMAGDYTPEEREQFTAAFMALERDGLIDEPFARWSAELCFAPATFSEQPGLVDFWVRRWTHLQSRAVSFEARSWIDKADRTEDARFITCPTLVVHGCDDVVLEFERSTKPLLSSLPNGRLAAIAGAGHTSNLEKPDLVNEAITNFLEEVFHL